MGRKAKLWKNQDHLTKLGNVAEDVNLTLDEQLRVKIALRYMRKAHTSATTREEAERKRQQKKKLLDPSELTGHNQTSSVNDGTVKIRTLDELMVEARNNFAIKKEQRKLQKESLRLVKLRPIFADQLIEQLHAEENREEEGSLSDKSNRDGHPTRAPNKKRPHSAAAATNHRRASNVKAGMKPSAMIMQSQEEPITPSRRGGGKEDAEDAVGRLRLMSQATLATPDSLSVPRQSLSVRKRAEIVPMVRKDSADANGDKPGDRSTKVATLKSHIANANQLLEKRQQVGGFSDLHRELSELSVGEEGGGGGTIDEDNLDPEAAAQALARAYARTKPSFMAAQSSSKDGKRGSARFARSSFGVRGSFGVDSFNGEAFDSRGGEGAAVGVAFGRSGKYAPDRARSFPFLSSRSSKKFSFFSQSAVAGDEKIQKVQQQREELQEAKDREIRRRIKQKELNNLSKTEMLQRQKRQRAWLVGTIACARIRLLVFTIQNYRDNKQAWLDANATAKAIGFIERWWRKGRVRLIFKRCPQIRPIILAALMPCMIRRRLRKKRAAATLLLTFLQDSTGISESMRAIYAYRQTIIRLQRWIRGWIAVQMNRMRILWLQCERIYKQRAKLERLRKLKEEKGSLKAMSEMEDFGGTVVEISQVRNNLGKLLDSQEQARFARQAEALFQAEQRRKQELSAQNILFGDMLLEGGESMATSSWDNSKSANHAAAVRGANAGTGGASKQLRDTQEGAESAFAAPDSPQQQRQQQQQHTPGNSSIPLSRQATAAAVRGGGGGGAHFMMKRSGTTGKKQAVPWHVKIRSQSAMNLKIFDLLREILGKERKRYVLNLVKYDKKVVGECKVDSWTLRQFLKNPNSYEGIEEISARISETHAEDAGKSMKTKQEPFLLLTKGGNDALEQMLKTHRGVRF